MPVSERQTARASDWVFGGQILGARESQEDSFLYEFRNEGDAESDAILVLADGMGGAVGGEVASRLAVTSFCETFVSARRTPDPRERLRLALEAANTVIAREIKSRPALSGMGCTLVGAFRSGHRLIWISVGDSLLLHWRRGQLTQLNADHSFMSVLMDQVAAGQIDERTARQHPQRNALRSAIVGDDIPLIDENQTLLEAGDLLLIASDGIDTLTHVEIAELCARHSRSAERLGEALLAAVTAKAAQRQDNTSVVVLRQQGEEPTVPHLKLNGIRQRKWPIISSVVGAVALAMLVWAILPPSPDAGQSPTKGVTDVQSTPGPDTTSDNAGDRFEASGQRLRPLGRNDAQPQAEHRSAQEEDLPQEEPGQ